MVQTPSIMPPLGFLAPDFQLPEPVAGGSLRRRDDCCGERGLLVMFICNHCPFVLHIEAGLLAFGRDYMPRGLGVVAINANDVDNYPEDAPELMAERCRERDYPFPYLYDESQQVARAYQAACTPDFFLCDSALRCVYRGRFDAARPGNDEAVSGADLCRAADQLLAGEPVMTEQQSSLGCNIKWKAA